MTTTHGDTPTSLPTLRLVLDLETTDSDPHLPHAAVLEVGAILVRDTPQLEEIARASLLIRPPGDGQDHTRIWGAMPPVVRDMHAANGLWLDATTSDQAWTLVDADRALCEWLQDYTHGEPVTVCGSGVSHIDVPFVKVFLPQLAARITYYSVDFGSVRRALKWAGRRDLVLEQTHVGDKPHRGLGDCELHLDEMRHYLALLASIPGAPVEPPAPAAAGHEHT